MAFPYFIMAGVFILLGLVNTLAPGSMIGMKKEQQLFKGNQEAKSLLLKFNGLCFAAGALFIALYYLLERPFEINFFTSFGVFLILLIVIPIKQLTKRLKTLAELNRAA